MVKVSFDVLDVVEVNERNLYFSLNLNLNLTWYEHRLDYFNLKSSPLQNLVPHTVAEKMWTPPLVFSNNPEFYMLTFKESSVLYVERQGRGHPTSLNEIREAMIYHGNKNPLHLGSSLLLKFKCDFKLLLFPFDRQECFAEVIPPFEKKSYTM